MNMDIINTAKNLSTLFSPSGQEGDLASVITNIITPDEITQNQNAIIAQKKGDNRRILLVAAIDTDGLVITNSKGSGKYSYYSLQNTPQERLNGSLVKFQNGSFGIVRGDIIDTQNDCIKTGDVAVLTSDCINFDEKTAATAGYSVGVVVALLIEVLRIAGESNNNIYVAFCPQGNLNGRGFATLGDIKPHETYLLSATESTNDNAPKVGGGIALRLCDKNVVLSLDLFEKTKKYATENSLSYQIDTTPKQAFASVLREAVGAVAQICVPVKYIGSSYEVISQDDIESALGLLRNIVMS